jgi:pyruvate/2-oxoglutarate dehydrogenase complex dihydrolipoamide dehydrogenase (E3) component
MEADVIVIGSGQAGVPLAVRLAKAGRRVVLFERGELGGTCVNDGCTPTKTMIASARAAHVARGAGRLGVRTGEVTVDFRAVVARKDAIVERWRDGVRRRLEDVEDRLELVIGHARFVGPHHVECAGRRFGAPVIVVNTGAAAAVPPIPGLRELEFLNNESAMQLGALPRHLLIAGGGYIGCEFSQMFRRFGAEVTVVDRNPQLLSREDPEIASALKGALEGEGVRLLLGRSIRRVDKDGSEIVAELSDGSSARGSHLMLAAGRRPNTTDLGCELAGIALDERGFIVVGDGYESSVSGIYAVGDVTGFCSTACSSAGIARAPTASSLPWSSRIRKWRAWVSPSVKHGLAA